MWRKTREARIHAAAAGPAVAVAVAARRVRFAAEECPTLSVVASTSTRSSSSSNNHIATRRRLSFPVLRSPKAKTARRISASSARRAEMHLAADEIERLLLDVSNPLDASQVVDRNEDDDDDSSNCSSSQDDDTHVRVRQRPQHAESSARSMRGRLSRASMNFSRRLPLASTCTTSSPVHSNNHNAELELTEQDVNAYGLFDSAGADEARLRRHMQLQQQQQQQSHSNDELSLFQDDDDDDDANDSATTTNPTHAHHQGVIYDLKKYGTGIPFFTPILILLTSLFCLLVVLRLLVSLLTVAVGWLVVILLQARLLHQLWHRPVHLLRLLHSRPLLAWAFLGGVAGMARVCWNRVAVLLLTTLDYYQQHPWSWLDTTTSTTTITPMHVLPPEASLEYCYDYDFDEANASPFFPSFESTHQDYATVTAATAVHLEPTSLFTNSELFSISSFNALTTSLSTMFSMQQDLVLIWGLAQGILLGTQVGILWLCLLGHATRPSLLADWMYHNVWRFAHGHYRELVRQRRQARLVQSLRQRQELLRYKTGPVSNTNATTTDDRKQCMICLEDFFDDEGDDDHECSSIYQRYYLLCRHSFHACCIQEWLEINASCPICRIPLDEALVDKDHPQGQEQDIQGQDRGGTFP